MGFFDTLKKAAVSAKCATGWHAGNYTPIDGEPLCHLEKTCPDCDKYVTTVKHKFDEWEYLQYGSCNAEHKCIHCGHTEQKVLHEYKEKGKDTNCRIIEVCSRCGDEKFGREKHNWISMGSHELKVQGKRKCKDCGKMES